MNTVTKTKWMMLAVITLLAACTSENELDNGGNGQGNAADAARREVLLSFKNKLAVTEAATKADTPIAITEENTVSSLDVYVFASDDEAGPFTYQERFAYRKKGVALPSGASSLDMQATGKENEYTALLSLQKGLFVKLYCIANQPSLVDPANEGAAVADAYFQPLIQTTPGQTGSKVKTAGIPTEAEFVSFHTPLLSAGVESDTLVCPLPMSGSYTRPLDLTDYAVSSRMQAGFKLTRMVSRFDITNDADQSKFTIESVSLAKGRRGVDFFTMTPFSSTPADPASDLITYPDRTFFGDKANAGTQSGAFYCYPSPTDDDAYLILKGKYRINQTEQKEVSYEVPFKQMKADGTGSYIEITPNHRYTVAITNATEEGVQFTLDVTDWDEGNEVDDYEPENTLDNLALAVPDAYNTVTRLVSPGRMVMSLDAGSTFTLSTNTGSTLSVTKTYSTGGTSYDWLEISEPVVTGTKAGAFGYTYTISLNSSYTGTVYPRATLKFKDGASGSTTKLIIDPVSKPTVIKEGVSVPNGDKIEEGSTPAITLYKHPDKVSTMQLKVSSYGGSQLEYSGTGVALPATVSSDANDAIYTLTATGAGTGTLKIWNKVDTAQVLEYSVSVIESGITLPADADLELAMATGETASLTDVSSVLGITASSDWGTDGIAWFDFVSANIIGGSGKSIAIKTKDNLMSLDASKVKDATVILATEGDTARFTVTPVWLAPVNATTPSAQPTAFTVNAGANTEIRLVSPVPYGVKVTSSSPSAVSFTSLDSSTGLVTMKGESAGSSTVTVSSQDGSNPIDYAVTVKELPASSYISITGSDGKTLKWAVGNLVAQGPSSCTIGSPTDNGVHFRWGSLVGYDANDATVNPATPLVKPNGYKDSPAFLSSPQVTDANLPASPSAVTAKGDPCRYYLGGSWRLPTADEYRNGLGGGVTSTTTFKVWEWISTAPTGIKTGPAKELFFPAAGYRSNSSGSLDNSGSNGYVWSSTPNGASNAYYLYFSASSAFVSNSSRALGFSVRCVQE